MTKDELETKYNKLKILSLALAGDAAKLVDLLKDTREYSLATTIYITDSIELSIDKIIYFLKEDL